MRRSKAAAKGDMPLTSVADVSPDSISPFRRRSSLRTSSADW